MQDKNLVDGCLCVYFKGSRVYEKKILEISGVHFFLRSISVHELDHMPSEVLNHQLHPHFICNLFHSAIFSFFLQIYVSSTL